ncbi:MAG: LamG domain-containing protein, partial [Candidatus Falkowbacteria bacterium]
GEAYYIDINGSAHYLKDGPAAYGVMRQLGLGIKTSDLVKINLSDKDKAGLRIVLKDFGMPDVKYLQPNIKEIQLKNEAGQWIGIWSDPAGKAVRLTPDGAETILDTVNVPVGTYGGTRLFITTMDVGVDVNRDGDILDKNVQTILTLEEFNKLPPKEKPSAPSAPAAPSAPSGSNDGAGGDPEAGDQPQGTSKPSKPSQPAAPAEPAPPYTIKDGYVYLPEFQDEEHTDTINNYIVPQMPNKFIYDGSGKEIVYDFTLHPLLPRGQHISIEVLTRNAPPVVITPATVLPSTILLDDFNGATIGQGFGTLTYEDSPPNLDKAVNLAEGSYIKYSFVPWYKWDGAHSWSRNEAASGVLTEGRVEMWINPRQYSKIMTFNWSDAESTPPAGYIMHFGFKADGKLTYSVWGGNQDQSLTGETVIPLNKWTKVGVSWGPSGTKMYVNGKVEYTGTTKNLWPAFSGSKVFVYLNYWGADDFGLVDDLQILNVAEPSTTASQ